MNVANSSLGLSQIPKPAMLFRVRGGCRKVRWGRRGIGKRSGVRVIHYNRLADGVIYLLLIYAKGIQDTIDPKVLKRIQETIDG